MKNNPSTRIIIMLILNVFTISSCVAPESKQQSLATSADICLRKGQLLKEAVPCLSEKGMKPLSIGKTAANYHSCGPYWGYPFMASCAGLTIKLTSSGTVENWNAWGALDGV